MKLNMRALVLSVLPLLFKHHYCIIIIGINEVFLFCRLERSTTIPHVPDVHAVKRCLGKGRRCTFKVI